MSSIGFDAAVVLARRERDKYRRLWQHDEYRLASPGESCAERALALLGARAGESIADFGCGTGRASVVFRRHGLAVRAIDHAENCLDPGVELPLEIACLWDIPRGPATDYGFCADVMEHIPMPRVDAVLAGIAARVRRATYFRIATVPDACGKLIGEPLHLTVEPAEWWGARVGPFFRVTHCRSEAGDVELIAEVRPERRADGDANQMAT